MAETTDIIYLLTWLYEIGTIVAIGLFVFSLYIIEKIIKQFPGGSIVKKWRIMQLLIVILSVIFIIDWIVWIYDIHDILFILAGIVRLSAAIFIVLIIMLFYRTYKLILRKDKSS